MVLSGGGHPSFGWPLPSPFTFLMRWIIRLLNFLQLSSVKDSAFGIFCDYRASLFARYLGPDTGIPVGVTGDPSTRLSAADLRECLERFDLLHTTEQWWESSAQLSSIFLSNTACFQRRLKLIAEAESSICLVVWSLDGEPGQKIVDQLIKMSERGVHVRLIIDAVNLYFLTELKSKFPDVGSSQGMNCLDLLAQLWNGGVPVKMLDTWYNRTTDMPYVIGTHRKIMLVDSKWLLTGGRNLEQSYVHFETARNVHKFHDADVLLRGDFSTTTMVLFEQLWEQSRSIASLVDTTWIHSSSMRVGASTAAQFQQEVPAEDHSLPLYNRWAELFRRASASCLEEETQEAPNISLFQLDHNAGRVDGKDIICTTLVCLLEKAERSIVLLFGYFQLFPVVEEALKRALARGVAVRLVTNSQDSNDLRFYNGLFRKTFVSLLSLGVEVYIPSGLKEFSVHYKAALIDYKALLLGSWNAYGVSVFYEAEFAVVMIGQDVDQEQSHAMFQQLEKFCDDLIQDGLYIRMTEPPPPSAFPLYAKLVTSRWVAQQISRGW